MFKKALLIPDSFKGTMSSKEVCEIMAKAIKTHSPDVEIVSIPVADGGEGTVDAFLTALGGEQINATVQNPHGALINSFWGLINGDTAIIEMAAAAGLPLCGNYLRPDLASTYGVGELIKDALNHNVKKIIIGLGGSATNDGGTGAAVALGVKFFDKLGKPFVPVGATLCNIAKIDMTNLSPSLKDVEIITMCDIDNPLCGENGAAVVFSPQKGADAKMVKMLDDGLFHLAKIIEQDLSVSVLNLSGGGAAGGMGVGMVAFFNSTLKMGIETVLDIVKFDELLKGIDIVFTGEGKIDEQSIHGKVISGVAHRTFAKHIPLIAIVGDIAKGAECAYEEGVTAIFSTNRLAVPYEIAKFNAKEDLLFTVENIVRYSQLF